ncbi:OadG family protein [Ruminococcaceae bacterium OttesenSCG-928-L11]|nr:OadG family protein [Ruminococcaceae bacterium OttesenSCG-928-L11]
MSIDWGLAANVVFSGLIIVFTVLLLLILLVTIMGKILGSKPSAPSKPDSGSPSTPSAPSIPAPPAPPTVQDTASGNEVVAVIAAAVNAYMEEDAPGTPYRISSIAPRAGRAKELRPAWGFAGMRQNTEPF